MKENEGVLKIKTGVKGICMNHDVFGFCTVLDCLRCNNSTTRIILPDERQIGDNNYYMIIQEEEKYLIEFFDKIPLRKEMEEYLLRIDSDYQLTRLSDGMIVRDRPIINTRKIDKDNTKKKIRIIKRNK